MTTTSSSSKCKILLVGRIGENVNEFVTRLNSLQSSRAGPFDACFCVGRVHKGILSRNNDEDSELLPMPVYLQDASLVSQAAAGGEITKDGDDGDDAGIVQVAPHLFVFASAQVASVEIGKHKTTLVVASCPARIQWDSESCKTLRDTLTHVSYVGCDLLLTEEWPQGIASLVAAGVVGGSTAAAAPQHDYSLQESFDVAQVALHARPRYHVAPTDAQAGGVFVQSQPFEHLAATVSTFTPKHSGRFLALSNVVSPARLKELGSKTAKYVHALGISPLQSMTATELNAAGQVVLANPYTDASYQAADGVVRGPSSSSTQLTTSRHSTTTNVGLSEAQALRLLSEQTAGNSAGGDSHARWATAASSKKRSRDESQGTSEEAMADNSDNTTLFIHGLHKDVRGMLQTGSVVLLEAFSKYGVDKVRRPPGSSSFAFLEFPSHELARACLEELGGETTVAGIHLTVKWATRTSPSNKTAAAAAPKRQRLMEADAMDSSTIYYRLPPKVLSTEFAVVGEELRVLMETSLERALADPSVTAKTEPALQVKLRPMEDKNFGFLEFASHAAASMALAQLTGSTDGGLLVEQQQQEQDEPPPLLLGVALHWAHDAKPPASTDDSHGLKFQRKHFPPDARKDCWFCLASPTCEKHLVVSVHEECYIAMPKGPIHPQGHVLIVPVTHSSKGALVEHSVANEMEDLKKRLQQHASQVYGMDLFIFERAIQTKGGYHTHVQCIPIERGLGFKLQATMMAMAKSIPGFELKELNSDLALSAMMAGGDDEDDDGGYFYAEVPMSNKETKRFLYRARNLNSGHAVVPLQFGREVLASVMDNPDLAHWKACVESQEKETELTSAFRESFAPFAPSD